MRAAELVRRGHRRTLRVSADRRIGSGDLEKNAGLIGGICEAWNALRLFPNRYRYRDAVVFRAGASVYLSASFRSLPGHNVSQRTARAAALPWGEVVHVFGQLSWKHVVARELWPGFQVC